MAMQNLRADCRGLFDSVEDGFSLSCDDESGMEVGGVAAFGGLWCSAEPSGSEGDLRTLPHRVAHIRGNQC